MKQVEINDTLYGPEEVLDHRERLIELRNHALKQNSFEWAVLLSVTIGLLQVLAAELNGDSK